MKIKILIILIFISNQVFSQAFREAFDKMDALRPDGYVTTSDAANLGFGVSRTQKSYLIMYKATKDVYYLNKFIIHSYETIMLRQDQVPVEDSYDSNNIYKAWCYTTQTGSKAKFNGWYQAIENGLITEPMAMFIYLVWYDDDFEDENLDEILLPSNLGLSGVTDFGDYADWLEDKVIETLDEFHGAGTDTIIDFWIDFSELLCDSPNYVCDGYWKVKPAAAGIAALNKQAAMAKTLLYMSMNIADTDQTKSNNYLSKATAIARQFALVLETEGDHYEWPHTLNGDYPKEDISHGAIEVELAYLCYKFQIQYNSSLIFNLTDMDRFARSITESAYIQPLELWETVFGDDNGCAHFDAELATGPWLFLSEYNTGASIDYVGRDIYHIASNIFYDSIQSDFTVYHSGILRSFAYLHYYQDIFNYISINKNPGPGSAWAGVEGGDIDGDGDDEFVAVRNYDGNFTVYEIQCDTIAQVNQLHTTGTDHEWADLALGDFDNDGNDEFVAVRNSDGHFLMYELSGSTIVEADYYTDPGPDSDWAGVAAGDFDDDGIDEIIAVRNSDGDFYYHELVNGDITETKQLHTTGTDHEWAGITAGDFDGDGIDEFVAARNSDGNILMYELISGSIQEKYEYTAPGIDSEWTDITAGDYNGDGIDEIIAHRNADGDFFMYKYENNAFTLIGHEYFTSGQLIDILGTGNFDNEGNDDLICLRNIDGHMLMFSLEGICQGVNLSDTGFDTDDYDTKDIHSNNTITVSNTTFSTPSSTELISGTKIHFKSGSHVENGSYLHAYIDNSGDFSCGSDPYYKTASIVAASGINIDESLLDYKYTDDLNIQPKCNIYPNPNTGRFNVDLEGIEEYATINVTNLLGSEILSKVITTNTCEIDLTNEPKGIYIVKTVIGDKIFVEKVIYK